MMTYMTSHHDPKRPPTSGDPSRRTMPDGPEALPPAHELIDRHGERLWLYATALVGDTHRAEDIVQETLLAALRNRDRFRPHADVERWLRGILRRVALRDRRRCGPLIVDDDLARRVDEVLSRWGSDREAGGGPELSALSECLERLDPEGREMLRKRYDESWSCQEIAESLGRSVTWVKVTLHRLRSALRRCVEGKLKNGHA